MKQVFLRIELGKSKLWNSNQKLTTEVLLNALETPSKSSNLTQTFSIKIQCPTEALKSKTSLKLLQFN
jgi:hypothetical protein